jgi:hypothetical protein
VRSRPRTTATFSKANALAKKCIHAAKPMKNSLTIALETLDYDSLKCDSQHA